MRHLLMDPAFPDLVAASVADQAKSSTRHWPNGRHTAAMPSFMAGVLRLLSRLR